MRISHGGHVLLQQRSDSARSPAMGLQVKMVTGELFFERHSLHPR
jgi:hypothetical protein